MNTDPDWTLYQTFAAVLDCGSLSAAGRQLGLTQPSVSRHIDQLEKVLDTELFLRTHRGMSPTQAAEQLRPHVRSLASTSATILRAVSQINEIAGVVRISASEIVGTEYLPPILARLHRSHPGLEIDLSLSNSVADLLQRQADIAIRLTEPKQLSLVVQRLQDLEVGLFAHIDYLTRHGTPTTLKELVALDLIGFDAQTSDVRALTQQFPALHRGAFALRTDSDLAHYAMIRAGFGIGFCHVPLARRMPTLILVLPEVSASFGVWVVMHEDLRATATCKAVFDALKTELHDP